MELTDRFEVSRAPEAVWALLWDLPRVAMCLPGCERVEAVDDSTFKARMVQRVGPFSVAMDLDLKVEEMLEGKRVLLSGTGKDRMGNRLKLSKLSMELDGSGEKTNVAYGIDFTLYGRLATLGSSVIKRKAEDLRVEFTKRLIQEAERPTD
jgi:carbon monoxide dehydrogenase subunit G